MHTLLEEAQPNSLAKFAVHGGGSDATHLNQIRFSSVFDLFYLNVSAPYEGSAAEVTFELQSLYLRQWFPTGGSRRSCCGVANSSLNGLLKSRIFRISYINILLHQQNRNTDRSL